MPSGRIAWLSERGRLTVTGTSSHFALTTQEVGSLPRSYLEETAALESLSSLPAGRVPGFAPCPLTPTLLCRPLSTLSLGEAPEQPPGPIPAFADGSQEEGPGAQRHWERTEALESL